MEKDTLEQEKLEKGDMNTGRVTVTGGAGFIGSHLVERLAGDTDIVVLDNFQSGSRRNVQHVTGNIKVVQGDVRNRETVTGAVEGSHTVFHLAANASVPFSIQNPRYDFETNAFGTLNVLEAARKWDVENVVYASSAAVYGESEYLPIDENHPTHPVSPYGVSKLAGEHIGTVYGEVYGLNFSAVRIFNTYGPRQPRYVMYDLLRKLEQDSSQLEVLGTGNQVRDYCYVTDMVDALMLVAEKGHGVYNVGGGVPTSVREVAEFIVSRVAPDTRIVYTGTSWKGDIQVLIANIEKIKALGFNPKVSLHEGIQELITWFSQATEQQP
ncbi:MAG: GDP-mannose 4,6-dehydratase [Theionarchaea archaeon]|nr:GDP-mannose 4,6-dehydratase [Theionarchaea archaeon]MBU6999781.1 GDP-mannose 4,6-dehydratase [Theionarchaea archaeon]MBU7020202.1 GDP-mannose 4,6-dehydratase [Theionarchaea archaeon]MBU7033681.1 GDP-mannose 4,6-dehydratase [Theionarchaea archaeon]MBU7040487.1 GDP-mannose 4,6-dehydratase [Theionarchaea archaeon]